MVFIIIRTDSLHLELYSCHFSKSILTITIESFIPLHIKAKNIFDIINDCFIAIFKYKKNFEFFYYYKLC